MMTAPKSDITTGVIGRAEVADFPDIDLFAVPVKIDTGADSSSIWAHSIKKDADGLKVIFLGPESSLYTGKEFVFESEDYTITRVANSFGHREIRYKIKMAIRIKGRRIKGTFSLASRDSKLYPVLIGRSLLKGKFVVDVAQGHTLKKEERERRIRMQEDLKSLEEK